MALEVERKLGLSHPEAGELARLPEGPLRRVHVLVVIGVHGGVEQGQHLLATIAAKERNNIEIVFFETIQIYRILLNTYRNKTFEFKFRILTYKIDLRVGK